MRDNTMMMPAEIETASEPARRPEYPRHPLEVPEVTLRQMFYPHGFPVEVRTNSAAILSNFESSWEMFEKRFDTEPIHVYVHVIESASLECPPTPEHHILQPLVMWMADAANFGVVDLSNRTSRLVVSAAALRYPLYLQYFFLEPAATSHLSTRYTTPVHAGCVALDGRGMLFCGESGAGKSTLSWACARAGWGYVSDDATFLLHGKDERVVTGNCHKVRLRLPAAELFPEIAGLEPTPRAEGKPSIEFPTANLPHIRQAEAAQVDFIVFLNRNWEGAPELAPYPREKARSFMHQVLFGTPELLAVQYAEVERLLTAEVYELRYNSLEPAIERLRLLAREGR
jgi:hypothetical protein